MTKLVFLLGAAGAFAQSDSACQVPGQSMAVQLPELRYTCLRLRNGRHVWVGQTGTERRAKVLLVHGLGQLAHRDWRLTVPALADKAHVIALDLPGFGASQTLSQGYSFAAFADALAEVLDALGVARAHVVGHSLGGALALYFAHAHAGRVDRLVLVDAAGILQKSVFVQFLARGALRQTGVDLLDDRIVGLGSVLLDKLEGTQDLTAWLAANPAVRAPLLGPYTQVDAAIGLVEHDFTRAIAEVRAPTVLIWGRDDTIAPLRSGTVLVGRMADARLYVLDGVAHVPMTESPDRFRYLLLPALFDPLPPKRSQGISEIRQGDVECRNRNGQVFSGYFKSLTLQNCRATRIENAQIDTLTLNDSEATITFSSIGRRDLKTPALDASQSRVTATVVDIEGAVGIRSIASSLDFAGVQLHSTDRGVKSDDESRLYFSVSSFDTPELKGAAHFRWPVQTAAAAP